MRVASSAKYDALLVADRAIGSDQDQSFVYVVDSKNIARLRHIRTGPDSAVRPQQGAMEQFSSNDTAIPLTSSKSSASRGDSDRNKATP